MKASVTIVLFVIFEICCSICFAQSTAGGAVSIKATVIRSTTSHILSSYAKGSTFKFDNHGLIKRLSELVTKLSGPVSDMIMISGEPGETIGVALNRHYDGNSVEENGTLRKREFSIGLADFSTQLDKNGESLVSIRSLIPFSDIGSSLEKSIYTLIISY